MVGEASGRMQKADCRDEIALPAAMLAWLKCGKQRTRNSRKRFLVFFCSLFVKARVVYRLRVIVCFTLLPITYPAMNPSGFEYNLDVSEMLLIFVNRGAIITYADNVLLFLPLTVLAYCSEYEFFRDIKWATIFSLLCSLSIELLQGVEAYARVLEDTMPVCDINDVICNTIGGILGFLLIYFYKREHNTDNKAKAE